MSEELINVDIAILGGGISGLWALNRLSNLGYQTILLENQALGSGQTLKSQGIIHGGLKYALKGFLNGSANAVEEMPARWKKALSGNGEIDCTTVNILSDHQLIWSTGSVSSEIASFFASKALSSRVQKLSRQNFPNALQHPSFKGHAYQLEEVVLDTPSLIKTLTELKKEAIYKINENKGYEFLHDLDNPQNVLFLKIHSGNCTVNIKAKRYLLTGGAGNEQLLLTIPAAPKMQRRSLQMVMVKFKEVSPFYGHCIDNGTNPRITITTHKREDGAFVWYLGGQLAEDGAHRSMQEQIKAAQKELNNLFPWLNLNDASFSSFYIDRAEPEQPGGKRPETSFVKAFGNTIVAWPTKLALAPFVSDQIINLLEQEGIKPSHEKKWIELLKGLERPNLAKAPWDEFSFQNINQ